MNNPRAKKQYGQNFLTNPAIPERIVKESGIDSESGVIEIGPGRGILTSEIIKIARKVVCIEIDDDLIPLLREKFSDCANISIIHGDIIETDLNALIESHFKDMKVFVVANIPYYITSPIITLFLENKIPIEVMTFMVQKEVAQRLTSQKGTADYSALTVMCNYYSRVRKLFSVPAGCFTPKPKVDSAVIRFDIKKIPEVQPKDLNLFFEIIKSAFAFRRKTLANCISSFIPRYEKSAVAACLVNLGYSPEIRGEELDIFDFCKISDYLKDLK